MDVLGQVIPAYAADPSMKSQYEVGNTKASQLLSYCYLGYCAAAGSLLLGGIVRLNPFDVDKSKTLVREFIL